MSCGARDSRAHRTEGRESRGRCRAESLARSWPVRSFAHKRTYQTLERWRGLASIPLLHGSKVALLGVQARRDFRGRSLSPSKAISDSIDGQELSEQLSHFYEIKLSKKLKLD